MGCCAATPVPTRAVGGVASSIAACLVDHMLQLPADRQHSLLHHTMLLHAWLVSSGCVWRGGDCCVCEVRPGQPVTEKEVMDVTSTTSATLWLVSSVSDAQRVPMRMIYCCVCSIVVGQIVDACER